MKSRWLTICLLLALFAFAAATLIKTDTIHGTGRAVNGDGVRAYFSIDATKVSHNDSVSMRGAFDMNLPGATSTDSRKVHLNSATYVSVNQNVGLVGGPGVLRVQHGTDLHYYEGHVYITSTSNRHTGEAGPQDTILVNFVPAVQGNPSLNFDGTLTDGDIAVTTNLSY